MTRLPFILPICIISLLSGCQDANPAEREWKDQLYKNLAIVGARNWIVIAESSFPAYTGTGIRTMVSDKTSDEVFLDVLNMLEKPGLMREIFDGFLCYLAGHPRPIAELLAPNWDTERIATLYAQEFSGMTQQETSLESLLSVTTLLPQALKSHLTDLDREFLLSFKQNSPDWSRYRYPEIQHLPAIRWKQRNLAVLKDKNPAKYVAAVNKLERVLA